MDGPKRICVIGGGPAGLSQLHAFRTKMGRFSNIEIVCYEKQSHIGGQWNIEGLDFDSSAGEPKSSCMYKHLWTNGPKECLEYPDYPFIEHFKKPTASYPPREVLTDYILARARKSDILNYIKLGICVRWLHFDAIQSKFIINIEDLRTGGTKVELFDYVIVATGHFLTPNFPKCNGIETFTGPVIHSRQVRDASQFESKHLVIVGSGFSAEDIGMQALKYGAKSVTYSYRKKPMGYKWPENVEEKPAIAKVSKKCVCFIDGSSVEADVIIFATGYLHSFPFLEENLKLTTTKNSYYPPGLYKGVAWINNTRLFYLGMQNQHYTFTMFDAQAFWVMDVILGKIHLPEKDLMIADSTRLFEEADAIMGHMYEEAEFQTRYVKDLLAETNHTEMKNLDFDLLLNHFHKWNEDRHRNIMTYRDESFTSAIDGTVSVKPKISWVERTADFDSTEAFLAL